MTLDALLDAVRHGVQLQDLGPLAPGAANDADAPSLPVDDVAKAPPVVVKRAWAPPPGATP